MRYFVSLLLLVFIENGIVVTEKVEMSKAVCNTSCITGFIKVSDSCSFTCTVTLDESPKQGSGVRFQIKRKENDYMDDLRHLDLYGNCLGDPTSTYKCDRVNENVFNITYQVEAGNYEKIRCKYKNITSKDELFPKVIETSDVTGILKINGLEIKNQKRCSAKIDGYNFSVNFDCISVATPCFVQIMENENMVINEIRNNVVYNGTIRSTWVFITVNYAACSLEGTYKQIGCLIRSNSSDLFPVYTNNNMESVLHSYVPLLLCFPALLVGAGILCLLGHGCRKKLLKHKRDKKAMKIQRQYATSFNRNKIVLHHSDNVESSVLIKALRKGEYKEALSLINKANGVNESDEKGITPLMIVACLCKTKLADTLIKRKADINAQNCLSESALFYASINGNAKIVVKLIKHGADINVKNKSGETPLYVASLYGKTEIVQILVKSKADVATRCNDGNTPLHVACQKGDFGIVQLIVKGCEHDDETKPTQMLNSAGNEHAQINQRLISVANKIGINIGNKNEETPLHYACSGGHIEIVKFLIKYKASIDAVNSEGNTPLLIACQKRLCNVAEILIENKADICYRKNEHGNIALHFAVEKGYVDLVKILIKDKAGINVLGAEGNTPLMCACMRGNNVLAKLLIENGAEVDKTNRYGNTALHFAVENGYVDVVTNLIINKAGINLLAATGNTPLMCACMRGNGVLAKLLIENGADINKKNNHGKTALDFAVENKHDNVVEILKGSVN